MISLRAHPEGCLLAVHAQPGARRNGIVGEQAEALKIAVTAPAEQGRANEAIIEVLAEHLGMKRAQIELIRGASGRTKTFLLHGMTVENVRSQLAV